MKNLLPAAMVFGLLAGVGLADDKETDSPFKNNNDKASYSIGLNIGASILEDELGLNLDLLMLGIRDGIADKAKLSDEEIREVMTAFQDEIEIKARDRQAKLAETNKKAGEAFLADNKKKEGVKTLESGLQYKVIKSGDGASPKVTDTVTTNYRGTLIDGTEFDSSYERGMPATFPVGGVIRGWTEALQKMKVGDKWMLYIPSQLAYGPEGRGGVIGPNATLVFEIELLGIGEE